MFLSFFFFQAEDGIRDTSVTGVQTCALPIYARGCHRPRHRRGEHQAGAGHAREPWPQQSSAHQDAQNSGTGEAADGGRRSEERRVGKSVEIGGGGSSKRKKRE